MNEKTREVAKTVLKCAAGLDRRMVASDEQLKNSIDMWALAFEGKVWPTEGIEAVIEHYSKPNAFPIMPGDVISYCAKKEPWSSPDHAKAFLWDWAEHPYSHIIEDFTGVPEPVLEPVSGTGHPDPEVRRSLASSVLKKWVSENEARLVEALIARKYRSPHL